jgi:MtN3 and saliva related transmembrane protein
MPENPGSAAWKCIKNTSTVIAARTSTMNTETIIGIMASIGTAISMLPQLLKTIKEKKAEDISMLMMSVLVAGLGLWVWYGILKNDWIIIISNSFSLSINVLLLIFTARYKERG